MGRVLFLAGMLVLTSACANSDASKDATLSGLDPKLSVPPTRVMVLGTPHLAAYEGDLEPAGLTPLLDALEVYAPDVITIESVPAATCELIRQYPNVYPGVADNYCFELGEIRIESGLDARQAETRSRELLEQWPMAPGMGDRRRLASAFLSAGHAYSALIHWMQIPDDQRNADSDLGSNAIDLLMRLENSMNESTQVGVKLAVRLGQRQIFAADDHSADAIIAGYGKPFWEKMSEIWSTADGLGKQASKRADEFMRSGNVVNGYRIFNDPIVLDSFIDDDFRKAMNDSSDQAYGRKYVAWWQARNLRMVSHIMAAAATRPGGKVLSIVGASHKPYFDAYLDNMHDVEVVDSHAFLMNL